MTKVCAICGCEYQTKQPKQKYCSNKCRAFGVAKQREAYKRALSEERAGYSPGEGYNPNPPTKLTCYLVHAYYRDGETIEEIAQALERPIREVMDLLVEPLPEWYQWYMDKKRPPIKR